MHRSRCNNRRTRFLALPLLLVLGGCGTLSAPVGTGGPVVAGHLGYMKGYLESGATERARMRQSLEAMPLAEDPRSRLRYAILLSLQNPEPADLERSLAMLEELGNAEGLTPAERWLAKLWHGEVASRHELKRENADIRAALEQAEDQIEQLTMIEEQLEAENSGSEEQ